MRFRTRPSLLARLKNPADQVAWREFVESYQPFIRHVSRAAGLPRRDVRDVEQDVLLQVLRRLPGFQYDPERGQFRSWLARIVRNRCIDIARRARRESSLRRILNDRPRQHPPEERGESCQEAELRSCLQRVRQQTRPQAWSCFEQHVLHDRPAGEVAAELGVTVNVVYLNSMRISRRVQEMTRSQHEQGQNDDAPVSLGT